MPWALVFSFKEFITGTIVLFAVVFSLMATMDSFEKNGAVGGVLTLVWSAVICLAWYLCAGFVGLVLVRVFTCGF
jgi:hypothetical protein